jgi:RND family efflux transporter MFP subunit
MYVGTLQPWVSASIGPQLVSAYIDTVLVRPGAVVKKHEVLATLDCKSASAGSQAVAASARALDARLKALADESARYKGLLDGGFVATNEVEQRVAATSAQSAEVNAAKAKLLGTTLEVNDCILRSPFDGEVTTRTMDPGAFVRPGVAIVAVVDRSTVRLSGDAPEVDFGVVSPGTDVKVHVLSTNQDMVARISRRAPAADPTTRTVHFEVDLADPSRSIPVGTTGEIRIEVGEPVPAVRIPLSSASVRNGKAVLFVVEGDVARSKTLKVLGESGGSLFVETTLPAGAHVVAEGRALLQDGDKVAAKVSAEPAGSVPTTSGAVK